jgi:N-acetylneuraminic acid mutarotase
LLGNKKVLVAGGINSTEVAGADLYDPSTGKFTATGNLNVARRSHTATLLRNGKVLIIGGSGAAGTLVSAELYDPATGKFTGTGDMNVPRTLHTATLLKNGKVLVTGGQNGSNFLASAEVYDPATGLFTPVNSMGANRVHHVAALLPDGKVLVAGGFGGTGASTLYHASAELYDPATNSFSPTTNSMSSARWLQHSSTLQLAGGKILITGGRNGGAGSTMLTSADVYNPATGLFSATGTLLEARQYHSATLLLNGKVLVAGGMATTGMAAISTAELYH